MDVISKIFVLPILFLALGTISIIAPIIGIEAPKHRYVTIDGMRGFLAMFVFLHHSSSWYYFARINHWSIIPSSLYNQFGSTSVAVFFMITSFLFFTKLIDSYGREFDWLKLYVGRIVRIMPLYIVAVCTLFVIVGCVTRFTLQESFGKLLLQFGQWLMIMEPNVNGMNGTKFVICGVQWSLAYEWLFYCSLAIIGWVFLRLKPSLILLLTTTIFGVIFALIISRYYPSRVWLRLWPFASGLVAAIIARNDKAKKIFSNMWVSPVLVALLAITLFFYPLIFTLVPFLCMTIVFIGISCGNDLFGIFSWKPCRLLGQITYSVYLLHGLLLFITFYFILGLKKSAHLTILEHWITISIVSVFVVIVCSFTYYYIEKPGTESAGSITKRIREFFGWTVSQVPKPISR